MPDQGPLGQLSERHECDRERWPDKLATKRRRKLMTENARRDVGV